MIDPVKKKVVYSKFKNIRNRISKLNGDQLLEQLLRLLHHPDAGKIERLQNYELWNLLLLVKWTILYGSPSDKYGVKQATSYEVDQLMNKLKDLSNHVRDFDDMTDVFLFLRSTLFQQIWVQRKDVIGFDIARQYLLFGKLEGNHAFQESFREVTDVSITDFLELSWGLFTRVLADKQLSVTESYFSTVQDEYESDSVSNFLRSLSHTVLDARAWLQRRDADVPKTYREIEYEYFEPSPFTRYPLIRHDEEYYIISPDLLLECLSEFVYDVLRDQYAEKFMNKFGGMFEELVERSLRSAHADVLTESDLKRHFTDSAHQQIVDFAIVCDECYVFIETKAVAMRPDGMVTDRPGTVRARSKSSVLKGIEQAYALANALQNVEEVRGFGMGDRCKYLIIVTYKDLIVGNGQLFRDHIAPDEVDKIISKYGGEDLIPLSNVFIVSIDDFDILMGSVYHGTKSLSDYLESAASSANVDANWTSFRQLVLAEGDGITMLPYLEDGLEELSDRLRSKLLP